MRQVGVVMLHRESGHGHTPFALVVKSKNWRIDKEYIPVGSGRTLVGLTSGGKPGKEYEMKIGDKRPSQICADWCDGVGCYDEVVKMLVDGKEHLVWVSRCKEFVKLNSEIASKVNKIIRRKAGKRVK